MFRTMPLVAFAALTLIAAAAPATISSAAAQATGSVVLVHGAFGDGSSWAKVIPLLEERKLEVIAVQLPLTSLVDDVAATQRAIARASGPVTLVEHSWGGSVITEAGTADKVKTLVYVTAFANDENTNFQELAGKFPPAPGLAEVVADKDGFARLSAKGIREFFAPQAGKAEQALLIATQGPIKAASFGEKVQHAAWMTKPSWFVLTAKDQMIQPALQEAMAQKIKAKVTLIESDHAAALSHPKEVAAAIIDAALTK
ncbi:alpha/beta hydrolase [Aquabacter sp. CN5-332]